MSALGTPGEVPNVMVNEDSERINGISVTLTLSWEKPFSYFAPIISYTVSCSGDSQCPPDFTTTDSSTRSHTITNLTSVTNYTFSVVATNSFDSGKAGVLNYPTPGESIDKGLDQFYIHLIEIYHVYVRSSLILIHIRITFSVDCSKVNAA